MTALPQPIRLVLLVDGKPRGGGVVEDQVDVELEEIGGAEEHLLLDRLGMCRQNVARPIELVDLEPLGFGQPGDVGQPALGAGELGAGLVQPVGRHREQGRFVRRAQTGRLEPPAHSPADAELLPQRPRRQHHPELEHLVDLDLRQLAWCAERSRIDLDHPVDALDQSLEGLAIDGVGAAEIVHDPGLGALGRGVPDILGQRVVSDGRAVAVPPLGEPQIHAQCVPLCRDNVKRHMPMSCV
jgi:hypothetical protein